jgi:hypothetical protein
MGGLSRRATIIADLKGTHFTVDAGNFAWKSGQITADRLPQQRRKAELQLDAFALSGIDGVAPGVGDLALGVAEGRRGTAGCPAARRQPHLRRPGTV